MKQGRTPIEDGTSGDLGLTPPGYDLPPLRGLNQGPRRHDPKTRAQQDRQQQWPGVALSKSNASSDQGEPAQGAAPTEPTVIQ
jgi:hypothetical protein